jgi:YegS/Rv2252/BmrU family lipid kinase
MPRRALFLANRNARRGVDLADQAATVLHEASFSLIRPDLADRSDLSRQIIQHAPDVDRVIVVGGDGSINAALPGVLETRLPLGIIPAGTANDLARTLGLPDDPADAARTILADRTRPIDVGVVNDIPFINAASMGLSVGITRQLTKPLKRRWGPFAYVLAAARAMIQARAFHVSVTTAETTAYLKTVQLVIGNGRYFGTGMTVHEEARIDDARLDLYSVGVYHWWSILALLPSLRRGTHESQRSVFNASGTGFKLETLRPRSITADGELLTRTPASFSIKPAAVSIFAPPDPLDESEPAA